jgi:ABC-type enterochelin transport system ATPase subunit
MFMDGKCRDIITNGNLSELYSMDIRIKKRKIGFMAEISDY